MEHIVDEKVIIEKLYEIFKEAENGRVLVNTSDDIPFVFNVAFQVESNHPEIETLKENSTLPILEINNFDKFIELITKQVEYYLSIYDSKYPELTESNLAKLIMTSFFMNMTYEDFQNPLTYLQNVPHSHQIDGFFSFDFEGSTYDVNVTHRLNNVNLETIDRLSITIDTEDASIVLPSVNYSINNNKAYIKCIQSKSDNNPHQATIAALLPKVSGTSNSHMRNVNPLHLLSLTIAIKLISEQTDVDEFIFPTLMPVRYLGLIETLTRKTKIEATKNNIEIDEEQLREEIEEKCNRIQTNITNKFINTIHRFSYHVDNFDIHSFDDYASYISLVPTDRQNEKKDFLNTIVGNLNNKRIKK